ncbi:hypothetical protein R3P38DRAFT_2792706 [Favolaschia claudopus]|uniref:Uncharacterized protein n=1 Tax=Favolaschia claudopus TaxID=2862362 RepID=A0AAW0AEG9_9AGAR
MGASHRSFSKSCEAFDQVYGGFDQVYGGFGQKYGGFGKVNGGSGKVNGGFGKGFHTGFWECLCEAGGSAEGSAKSGTMLGSIKKIANIWSSQALSIHRGQLIAGDQWGTAREQYQRPELEGLLKHPLQAKKTQRKRRTHRDGGRAEGGQRLEEGTRHFPFGKKPITSRFA